MYGMFLETLESFIEVLVENSHAVFVYKTSKIIFIVGNKLILLLERKDNLIIGIAIILFLFTMTQ